MRHRHTSFRLDHIRREILRARRDQKVSVDQLSEAAGYANHGHLGRWLAGEAGVELPYGRLQAVLGRLGLELTITHKSDD